METFQLLKGGYLNSVILLPKAYSIFGQTQMYQCKCTFYMT